MRQGKTRSEQTLVSATQSVNVHMHIDIGFLEQIIFLSYCGNTSYMDTIQDLFAVKYT